MSLINKVINDLEERQAFAANKEGRIFRGLTSTDRTLQKNRLMTVNLFVVILFLVASVSATYALMGNRADKALQEMDFAQGQEVKSQEIIDPVKDLRSPVTGRGENIVSPFAFEGVNSRIAENALKLDFSLSSFILDNSRDADARSAVKESKARIESINVSEANNGFLLELELAAEVDYRAYALSNPNRIVVEIDAAEFDGQLPELADLSGVRNIRLQRNHADRLILVMDTLDAYSVDALQLIPAAYGYALTVSTVSTRTLDPDLYNQVAEKILKIEQPYTSENAEYGEMKKSIRSNGDAGQARMIYIDAQELYRHGKYPEANELLTTLLSENQEYRAARTLLAKKLIEQGQLAKAEELLRTGLSSQAGDSDWTDLYARLLVNKGDVDTAIEILTSVTPDLQAEPDYYAFLAALYQKSERHGDAVLTYRQVLQVKPANSVWWMGLAISLESLQQNSDALFAYKKALQGDLMSQDLQKYVHSKINYLNKRS